MTTVIGGSAPSITFSDSTTQSTAFTGLNQSASPYTTSLGYQALNSNTGANNTAVGYQALYSNSTAGFNVAIGYTSASGSTGTGVTAVGAGILVSNTGNANTAIGTYDSTSGIYGALTANTSGSYNVGVGTGALRSNTTASNNTAVGYQAGYSASTQSYNTFLGYQAGYTFNTGGTIGGYNCFVGFQAGYAITTGIKNTILGGYNGNQGGLDIRTSNNYIVLSDGDGNPRGVFDNNGSFLVGTVNSNTSAFKLKVQAATDVCVGINSAVGVTGALTFNFVNDANSANIPVDFRCNGFYVSNGMASGAGTNALKFNTSTKQLTYDTSSARYKKNIRDSKYGLVDVLKMRSTQFEYKDDGRSDVGLIAEELQSIIPELVGLNEEGLADSVSYDRMVSVLIKAIQELKAEFDSYKATHP